jgi:hypothetical protein
VRATLKYLKLKLYRLMDARIEEELITRLKEHYGKMPLSQLQSKLRVSKSVFYYLLGKAGLPLEQRRVQTITVVHWRPTREGGNAPVLRVSRYIVRKMGLKDGDKVQWIIEKGRIVGIPLTVSPST